LGGFGGNGFLDDGARRRLPERRAATALAKTKDAFIGGADVRFDGGAIDVFERFAGIADEQEQASLPFGGGQGRKLDLPEIEAGIEEGHAVGVAAGVGTDLADNADFGFLVTFGPTEKELLLGGKLVLGDEPGAMEAEEDGLGVLREELARQIAADEEDGDFFRDATADTHNLRWQGRGQTGERRDTI